MFPWRKLFNLCLILLVFFVFSAVVATHVKADEIDDLQKQIDALNKAREQSVAATTPLEGQLGSLRLQLSQIQAKLNDLSSQIKQKQKDLDVREEKLAELTDTFNQRVLNDYKSGFLVDPLGVILGEPGKFSDKLYHLITIDQNRSVITQISNELLSILADKQQLEKDTAKLASLQSQVDQNASFLGGEINKAKAYQADLSNQIAALSAEQQSILSQRLSSLGIPLYASSPGGCSSDLTNGKSPGFSGGFGLFTYGVPNRVGLNQYGAEGRAAAGQSSDQILRAYYNFDSYQNKSGITINVNDGNGIGSGNIIWSGSLEDYLKRIYEVPADWPIESLKAQVIAARSYVLAETNNGSQSICANQHCQVFQTNPKGGAWEDAVNQTSGQVMVQGGSVITAYFSSTHGGYVYSSGGDISSRPWLKDAQDTSSSVSSFSDLKSLAYDKASPWFYCDWGSRSDYGGTAWLKPDEIADIVNAIMLASNDSSTKEHLYQTDQPNPAGTDTWDSDRVKSELRNRGITPFNSISSLSVSADFSSGRTTSVNVSGDAPSQSISGDFFKTYFNLRAPATIQIVGPLFNVERN